MTKQYIMKLVAIGQDLLPPRTYLASYDNEAADGRGAAEWTEDPHEALTFDTVVELFEAWKSTPVARPLREDGRPNRPLTTFSIEPTTAEREDAKHTPPSTSTH